MKFSEYWNGFPSPPPGIFPTQRSNPGLLHCRQILYHLSHQGRPMTLIRYWYFTALRFIHFKNEKHNSSYRVAWELNETSYVCVLNIPWCKELTHLKIPWCWERLRAGGEGVDRGWDGWMVSPTQWTWVWVNSRRKWRTGKLGMLQSMGLHSWTQPSDWTIEGRFRGRAHVGGRFKALWELFENY